MITISGLSKEQVSMLTHMWYNLKDEKELREWQATLSPAKFKMSNLLHEMVALATLDEKIDQATAFPEAKKLVEHVSKLM